MFTRSVGTSFWNPAVIRRQFPLLQEQRKKRDGSLQQSYRCRFIFCLSLEAVFYLRVLLSQNPVEPITAPYEIVKVYRFGRRRCPTTFPNPCIFQTANLIGRAEGEVLQFIEKDMCHSRISRLVIGIRSKYHSCGEWDWSGQKGSNF